MSTTAISLSPKVAFAAVKFPRALAIATVVFMWGCAAQNASVSQPQGGAQSAEQLFVVDCLLPGQIRKLGQSLTFVAPRRAVKTPAQDCEIRGGEYVAYDRANYATALKVWLEGAKAGDPEAQTYVGEIYEKGLGTVADYDLAAQWYRKAAQQGYERAQINLGYLYENGLGVERDLTTAMNWYREASGLTDGELEFVSSVEVANRETARRESVALRQEVVGLRDELAQARGQLDSKREQLGQAERQAVALREELQQLRQSPSDSSAAPPSAAGVSAEDRVARQQLEVELEEAQQEQQRLVSKLAQQQLEAAELRDALGATQAELAGRRETLAAAQRQLQRTKADLDRTRRGAAADADLEEEMSRLTAELEQREATIATQQSQLTRSEDDTRARQQQLQTNLDQRGQEVARLEAELAATTAQLAETKKGLNVSAKSTDERIGSLENEIGRQQQALSQKQRDMAELEARLAEERARLADELKGTRDELTARQEDLAALELQLTETRTELAQRTAGAERQATLSVERQREVERLSAELEQRRTTVASQQAALSELETKLQRQRSDLGAALQQAEQRELELEAVIEQRNQDVSALQTKLSKTEQQLAASRGSAERAHTLERELKKREAEIAEKQREIAELEANVEQDRTRLETSQAAQAAAPVAAGPTIEIITPPLSVTRGMPSVKLRSEMSEFELIGRVTAPAGLLTLRVNDRRQEVAADGVFTATLPVGESDTPVTVEAIDQGGTRTSVDFLLLSGASQGQEIVAARAPVAPVKRPEIELGQFYALVIGNNDYPHFTNLATPRNDARAVADLLARKYGFQTTVLYDANRYEMLSALNKLRETLTENDNLLIYYAGHGELDKANLRGYWLPVDAEPESTANWIPNYAITDVLTAMSAKHVLVVADSCYAGALTRSSVARLQAGMSDGARLKWYQAMANAKARAALTSGGVRPVLDAGGGDHSIFAEAFLEVLAENDGMLEGYRLYREVLTRVKRKSTALRMEQNPQYAPIRYAGHEAGEFLFFPVATATAGGPTRFDVALGDAAYRVADMGFRQAPSR